jgi:membrane-associated protease RseP (regulator of RpoE activity)
LRFWGEAPFPSELKAAYNIPFNEDVFWVLENTFYWIFWLNFLCGLTNILPITALDGGYMFQDAVDEIIKKLRVKEASRKKMVSAIGAVFSIIILLVIIIIPLIAPRI